MRLVETRRVGGRWSRRVRRVPYDVEPMSDGAWLRPRTAGHERHCYLSREAVVLFFWLLGLTLRKHGQPFNKRDRARRAERRHRQRQREAGCG